MAPAPNPHQPSRFATCLPVYLPTYNTQTFTLPAKPHTLLHRLSTNIQTHSARRPLSRRHPTSPSDMGSDKACPAYVEDLEGDSDNNRTVKDSRRSATSSSSTKDKKSTHDSKPTPPPKEKKKSHSDSGYSSLAVPTRADVSTTVKEVRVIPDPRESRRKSAQAAKSPRKSSRPPAQRVTFDHQRDLASRPKNRDDPRYFGERDGHPVVIQTTKPTSRPPAPASSAPSQPARAPRPTSLHGAQAFEPSRPPLSTSAYYSQQAYAIPIAPQPYPLPNPMQGSYFPVQPSSPSRDSLHDRFARTGAAIVRPASAAGYMNSNSRVMDRASEYDYESPEEEPLPTRADKREARRRAKELEDAIAMPPPPKNRRASIRQPAEYPTFPDARDFRDARGEYDGRRSMEFEPRPSLEERPSRPKIMYRETEPPARPRRQSISRVPTPSFEPSFDYDKGNANIRVERRDGRRNSYYDGTSPLSSNYEEKVRDAAGYQNEVSGGETMKLTADVLRKQQHTIGSSRGTRSSGSRDESDFKRSVTTRTTRSGSGPDADNVTIRIKGNATVNIAGAEITNADGLELNIINRRKSIRNGSEASRSEYTPSIAPSHVPSAADERRSRHGRGSNHTRSSSQSVRNRGVF